MIVYSDSNIIDLEWLPKIDFKQDYTVCHSFVEYLASQDPVKIAFTTHRLHCDHDINCAAYQGFEDKIRQLSTASKYVFSFESELHNFHWCIWEQCHSDNVYWVLPGAVNDREDINSHIVFWGDWFKTTSHVYKSLPHKLAQLTPYNVKTRYFDALLGVKKPHRDFVYAAVNQHQLNEKFVMTYGGEWSDNEFYAKDYFEWEPECVPVTDIVGTADWVDYCGVRTGLSRVIPLHVYNDTAYSIIAETDHDNTLSFYSEKTAKALIARRLFVAFTGYKFLHNLRQQGFRTFDGIIDESYDLIQDDTERYTAAFEQVRWLCTQPQDAILAQIQLIVEHNHSLIMTTDWTGYAASQICEVINSAQR